MSNEEEIFRQLKKEQQALQILAVLLMPAANGCSNDVLLGSYLERCGLYALPEELRGVLDMLERCALVRTKSVDAFLVVELTDAGERVAQGKQCVVGIARPPRG